MKATNRTYKCPFCNDRFTRDKLVSHVSDNHNDNIPEDFTPFRYVFHYVNKKPLTYHGICTECKKETPWDEERGRYKRQCGRKACHDSFVKKFENNMIKTKGVTRISATASGQVQMLANRKISGVYKFQNGAEKTYTGSYEKSALEFMDRVLNIDPDDLMCPGPILEYTYKGKTHIYITDFYYQPYNLIIEVKDGGDNPNKRNMPETRAKQIEKEKYIISHTNYNYLRLTNNSLSQLLNVFMSLRLEMVENTGDRIIQVNENGLDEAMNALMTNKVIGLKDDPNRTYITNFMMKPTFVDEVEYESLLISPSRKFDNVYHINEEGQIVNEIINFKTSKPYVYCIDMTFDEAYIAMKKLQREKEVITNEDLYEALFHKKLYSFDQIFVDENVVRIPTIEFENKLIEYAVAGNIIGEERSLDGCIPVEETNTMIIYKDIMEENVYLYQDKRTNLIVADENNNEYKDLVDMFFNDIRVSANDFVIEGQSDDVYKDIIKDLLDEKFLS